MIKTFLICFVLLACASLADAAEQLTQVSMVGDAFYINEQPTYAGRSWNGKRIEGLLFNSRMVQSTFDDLKVSSH